MHTGGERRVPVIIKGDGGSEPDLDVCSCTKAQDMSKSIRIFRTTGVDGIEGAAQLDSGS